MALNMRKSVLQAHSLDELVALGTLTAQAARFLEAAVAAGLNILVASGTQAGKTTLLNCVGAFERRRGGVVGLSIETPPIRYAAFRSHAQRSDARTVIRDFGQELRKSPSLEGSAHVYWLRAQRVGA